MKLQPKTFYDAILPIMIMNWFTGMCLFEYPLRKPQLALSFVNVIFSIGTYYYAHYHDPVRKYGIKKNIFHSIKYTNFFISAYCVLIGWYYYKAYKLIIKRIELVDEAFETLGLPNNYRDIFINSVLKILTWIVMIGFVILFDAYFLMQTLNLSQCLHMCYLLHYPVQLNCVIDLTFSSIVNYIGLKFDSINLLLKRILSIDPSPEAVEELYEKHSRISALIMSTERSDILNDTERQKKLLMLIKHLHMELTKISIQLNKIYQTQITVVLIALLASVTGFLFVLFVLIIFGDERFPDSTRVILSVGGWCALGLYRLLNINSACGNVSTKSRRTREILCEMKNTIQNAELREEIEQFALQLTQRPLQFSLCGFMAIDYSLVQGFMQQVTTYLILLIHYKIVELK